MDRGTWWATVHGVTRVRHDLATKPPNDHHHHDYWASLVSQTVKNLPAMQETWVGKTPGRREWQPTPVLLPREFHGQSSLAGYSPWGCRVRDD